MGKARPLQTRPGKSQISSDVTACLSRLFYVSLLVSYQLLAVTPSSLQRLLILYFSSFQGLHAPNTKERQYAFAITGAPSNR